MPLLSDQEQRELFGRITAGGQGGEAAKRQMVESNLRLVVAVARHYKREGVRLLDIIQEGNLGLIRAVERFDAKGELKFSTFATPLIRQAIEAALEP